MIFPRLSSPPTLTDTVAKQLLAEIDAGHVLPGEKLPTEAVLSEQFGVSRTVIREAVSRLRQVGVVEARQGSGLYVSGHASHRSPRVDATEFTSLDAVLHIIELRRALESEVAAVAAARRTDQDLVAIGNALQSISLAVAQGGDGVQEDVNFHRSIAHATGNPCFLTTLAFVNQYQEAATRVTRGNEARYERFMREVINEHNAIFQAIRLQDVKAAREAAHIHMVNAALRLSYAHETLPEGSA